MIFLFKQVIFRFHVNFPGCMQLYLLPTVSTIILADAWKEAIWSDWVI